MKKSLAALLACGVLGTLLAMAAEQPPPGEGRPPEGGPGFGGPGFGGPGPGGFRGGRQGGRGFFGGPGGMMGLDEQQRQAFDDAMQKESEKLRDLEEKLRTAQRELLEATLAADYSETTVRGKAEAVAKIQVDMTMLRAKALASVASTLKPEQKQQLLESPLGAAMLGGGGGGPRGFGGMMGPGGRGGGFPGRGFGEGRDPGPRER